MVEQKYEVRVKEIVVKCAARGEYSFADDWSKKYPTIEAAEKAFTEQKNLWTSKVESMVSATEKFRRSQGIYPGTIAIFTGTDGQLRRGGGTQIAGYRSPECDALTKLWGAIQTIGWTYDEIAKDAAEAVKCVRGFMDDADRERGYYSKDIAEAPAEADPQKLVESATRIYEGAIHALQWALPNAISKLSGDTRTLVRLAEAARDREAAIDDLVRLGLIVPSAADSPEKKTDEAAQLERLHQKSPEPIIR